MFLFTFPAVESVISREKKPQLKSVIHYAQTKGQRIKQIRKKTRKT